MKKFYKKLSITLYLICLSIVSFSQVTGGSFTGTCTTTGTANWTNGTNTTVIFAKAGSAITVGTPTSNISTISDNVAFGSGDAYQNDAAAFCVYKGTGTSVNITGLSAGVTYHFLAFDATGTTYSASHTFNGASLSTPPNATVLTGSPGNGQVSLNWTNPSCMDEILVVAKPTSTIAGTPTGDGTTYSADPNFGGAGTAFDTSGKVVYKNNSNSVTVTGLTNGTNYFFKVYVRKGTTWSSGVEINSTPYASASAGAFNTNLCLTTGTASWTNPATVGTILVFAKATNAITVGTPTVNISTYSADANFSGTGTAYEGDGLAKCVYKGTGTSVNITGLAANTTYHFLVYNASGAFYSASHTFNGTTLTTPPNVTGLGTTPSTTSVDLAWTNPSCFDEVLVVAKTATVSGTPTGDGTAYTADPNFGGTGTSFDTSGKVVYKSNSNSVTVTGLSVSTTYFFKVYTRKGTTWSAGTEVSTTTICTPVNVTALKISDASTTANLYWTDPACFDQFMIVAKQGTASVASTISVAPSGDGTAYTAVANFGGAGTAYDGGKVVFKSGANPGAGGFQVTGLTTGLIYTFKIFTRKGTSWSAGATITAVPGPPVLITSSLIPTDGSTGVSSSQVFSATFNENIFISSTAAASTADDVEFDPASGSSQFIARGAGAPSIVISGKTVTLTPSTDLTEVNTVYNILIGDKVFTDSTGSVSGGSVNDFAGTSAGNWNFTTATGTTITAPSVGTCIGQFSSLGDIVITETSTANFQGTDNGTFTIVLGFDKTSGFAFNPSTTGVTATATASGDIETIVVTSVSYTQVTLTVDFFNVSNNGQAKDDLDAITISGLKVSRDGSVATPALVVVKAATDLVIQGITEDTTPVGTISTGSASSAPTVTWPNSNDNAYCIGTTLSGITVTASGGSGYKWYNDAALTSNIGALNGNATPTAAALGFSSASAGTFTKYVTNSSSGCESSGTAVTLVITALPTAEAGTSPGSVCPGTSVNIGGSPTATGGVGSYTYSWASSPVGFSSSVSNPIFNAANATASDVATTYTVTVTDGNGCTANDNVLVTVKNTAEIVIITQPSNFNFTTNQNPINLRGSPKNGIFSGTGVIQMDSAGFTRYQFDPEIAGIGTWPITYTATLANGCTKSTSPPQDFIVSAPYDVFPALESQYCNTEGPVSLAISGAMATEIQNYIDTWNTTYVSLYGYAPLKPTWTGVIRNEYEYYYGDNNGVIGSTFYPQNFPTDQAYPPGGGEYGVCPTCTYAYIAVFLEFASPTNTYPYNYGTGIDYGWYYNTWNGLTGNAGFEYRGEFVYVNPVPVVGFSGLAPNYCDLNVNIDLTGNKTGGFYEISSNGSSFGDSVNPPNPLDGIKDASELVAAGLAIFNPLEASGGAVSPVNRWIKYSVDPGTVGSTSYIGPDGTNKCVGSQTQSTTIYPSTSITFGGSAPSNNSIFCYEGASIDITTNLGTGTPPTGITFSGYGISDNGNGSAKWTPKTAFDQQSPGSGSQQDITISVTYTNSQGCAYTINRVYKVNPKPTSTIGLAPDDDKLCYNDSPITITGNQPANSTLKYAINYLSLNHTDSVFNYTFDFNPSTYYDAAVSYGANKTSDAIFDVSYIVKDQNNCTATTTRQIAVSPLATITIGGISDGDKFCSNVSPFPVVFGPLNGTLRISVNGGPSNITALNPIDNSINSVNIPIGNSVALDYEYKSGVSQCTSNLTYTISKVDAPKASFTTTPVCDGNPASFTPGSDPNNYKWIWDLGDGTNTVTTTTNNGAIQYVFPPLLGQVQNPYKIGLTIENDPSAVLLCKDSAQAIQIIGAYPNADFSYANVCENDFTALTIANGSVPIATAQWDFGDGFSLPIEILTKDIIGADLHGGKTQNKYGSPQHQFAFTNGLQNYYNIQLTVRTPNNVGACPFTIQREVGILEKLAPTPASIYDMSTLTSVEGLWLKEDRSGTSTWTFATPSGKTIIDGTEGAAWITNASAAYNALDNSFVNSPCFDLSAFAKPVISLHYWSYSDAGKDGAVLQYSTNGGALWQNLGTASSGLNWYNNGLISSKPGNSQTGWHGETQTRWLTGKNSLDDVAGLPNVRFRIAFASDERDELDGFAFNNVIIEERNRIMLVEHFSNADTQNANITTSTTNYNNLSGTEIIKMQYHTSFPDPDPIHDYNPADNNARAAFYGLTSQTIPMAFIDGGREVAGPYANVFGFVASPADWWTNFSKKRSLSSSPYLLTVASELAATTEELKVHVTGNRIGVVTGLKPTLQIAIIEKSIGTNQNVLRKLLPNASGTALDRLAATVDVTETWHVEGLTDLSDLAIIAFIQDEATKEIFQTTSDFNPSFLPTTPITRIEDSEYAEKITLYPNPANQELFINLPTEVSKYTPFMMYDSYGKVVHESRFGVGQKIASINTSELAGGVYIIHIPTPDGGLALKKVMVVH